MRTAALVLAAVLAAPSASAFSLTADGTLNLAAVPWAGPSSRSLGFDRFEPGRNGVPLDATLTGVSLVYETSLAATLSITCETCTVAPLGGDGAGYFLAQTTLSGGGLTDQTLGLEGGFFGILSLTDEPFSPAEITASAATVLAPLDLLAFTGPGEVVFTLESTGDRNYALTGGFGFDDFTLRTAARLSLTYTYDSQTGPTPPPPALSAVPVPPALPLLLAGLGVIAVLRRR